MLARRRATGDSVEAKFLYLHEVINDDCPSTLNWIIHGKVITMAQVKNSLKLRGFSRMIIGHVEDLRPKDQRGELMIYVGDLDLCKV